MRPYEERKRDAIDWITKRGWVPEKQIRALNRDISRERSGDNESVFQSDHVVEIRFPIPNDGRYELTDLMSALDDCADRIVEPAIRAECEEEIVELNTSWMSDALEVADGQFSMEVEVMIVTKAVPLGV